MSSGAVAYNGTTGTADSGYSSGVTNLNIFYDTGHMSFITISSVLVLLMIPGVGFFYSGLARRKSALQLVLLSMISVAIISFQWFFWGYSLAFSRTGNAFLGDLSQFGLMKTLGQPNGSTTMPDILFFLYQGMFAAITPALAIGAVADRGRMLPAIVAGKGVGVDISAGIVHGAGGYSKEEHGKEDGACLELHFERREREMNVKEF
ncbi:hypothetical protein NQ176_g9660 [Zarea fungicola]|uniref:Uncharacterized protein n=1 Tax=Zarea fungicola TaxID=93591 RepID=A0ACC1ML81_9HYPO|nr:hypothetical protein NQ176_g9660 [Lecanicillium fungicola]